ncbi:serine/threonine protein kinase, partial [Streptomyces sp. NPDC056254]
VVAYAATARLPFGDATQPGGLPALLLRSTEAEPDLAGVPAELLDLVRDCLHPDPAARPGPAEVLDRVGADGTVADGRALEPWLPTPLVAGSGGTPYGCWTVRTPGRTVWCRRRRCCRPPTPRARRRSRNLCPGPGRRPLPCSSPSPLSSGACRPAPSTRS